MSTKAPLNPFAALTWDDVEAWAGSSIVSRGKSYQRSNRVRGLARTASGGIIAWVQGTSRYATQVEIAKKKLTASCTCPYGGTCKHAVAVVLSYLECLKNQRETPTAAEDDPRFDLLKEAAQAAAAMHSWEPGIASQLRLALRERREQEQNWPQVAAFYAEDFFDHPGARTLIELQKAAKRAGVEAEVRAGAFYYLETGIVPQTKKPTKKTSGVPAWPLPECEVKGMNERRETTAPMIDALIDIAITEKRPDDVLRWYDQQEPRKISAWGYSGSNEDRIATAVVDAYPDRAVAIWKKLVESQLGHAEVRAYETAAIYLRKVHSACTKHGQEREWKTYLATLRQTNLRRPRLVQILDSLTGHPIVDL